MTKQRDRKRVSVLNPQLFTLGVGTFLYNLYPCTWSSGWFWFSVTLASFEGIPALSPKEATWSKSVRSSLEVVCEDNSKPLSVAGLTADETFSELPEELGGASMKVTPLADEKQKQRDQYYSVLGSLLHAKNDLRWLCINIENIDNLSSLLLGINKLNRWTDGILAVLQIKTQ